MRTWRTLEVFYGAIYLRALWRRTLITLGIVFALGFLAGWLVKGCTLPAPPTNLHITRTT